MFYNARDAAIENAYEELGCEELGTEPQMIDMIGRGPRWLNIDIWDELVHDYWATDKFIKKSATARNNRMTKKDGSITKHSGGSAPYGLHKIRLQLAGDQDVNDFVVFEHTHKRKATEEFIDPKSKRVSEEYRAKTNCSDSSIQPPYVHSDYCEVTGGPAKGRLYGIGRIDPFEGTSRCSSSSIASRNDEMMKMAEAIEEMRKMTQDTKKSAEEESKKREEERQILQQALEDSRRREEDSKRREDALLQLLHKMHEEITTRHSSSKRYGGK